MENELGSLVLLDLARVHNLAYMRSVVYHVVQEVTPTTPRQQLHVVFLCYI